MSESRNAPAVARLSELAARYDAFILDLWGCLHNGVRPYPGVVDAMRQLRARGKQLLVLSNAPRRAQSVAENLPRFGLDPALFDHVLTSGEMAWRALAAPSDDWHRALGRRCLRIGPGRDSSMLEGNDLIRAEGVDDADFLLATGPMDDSFGLAEHESLLAAARARDLPMVCANPDLVVVRGEERLICAGALARRYGELGGAVRHHGKPFASVYVEALAMLGGFERARILAIGDGLMTDVKGASEAGIDSALIPGGILGEPLGIAMGAIPDPAMLAPHFAAAGVAPTYLLAEVAWD